MSKNTIVTNLQEFLDSRGCGDSPWQWARAFYKYTGCGPWSVFIMRDQPAIAIEDADIYYGLRNRDDEAVKAALKNNF